MINMTRVRGLMYSLKPSSVGQISCDARRDDTIECDCRSRSPAASFAGEMCLNADQKKKHASLRDVSSSTKAPLYPSHSYASHSMGNGVLMYSRESTKITSNIHFQVCNHRLSVRYTEDYSKSEASHSNIHLLSCHEKPLI
jgi:hypothetical protein